MNSHRRSNKATKRRLKAALLCFASSIPIPTCGGGRGREVGGGAGGGGGGGGAAPRHEHCRSRGRGVWCSLGSRAGGASAGGPEDSGGHGRQFCHVQLGFFRCKTPRLVLVVG